MKKSTMIFLLILGVGLIAAGLMMSGGFYPGYGGYATLGTYAADEVAAVRSELGELSLQVYESRDKKALEVSGSGRAVQYVDVRLEGGVLTLRENTPTGFARFFSYDRYKDYAVVYVPKAFSGELTLSSGSGGISLSGLRAEELRASLSAGSGDAETYDCRLGALDVKAGSGRVWVGSSEIGALTVSAGSGDVSLSQTDVSGETSLAAGSGSMSVSQGEFTALSLRSGSGYVWVDSAEAGSLTLTTSSGDVSVGACELGSLRAETDSGSFRAEDLRVGTAAIRTGSGNVRLIDSAIAGAAEPSAGDPDGSAALSVETGSGDVTLDSLRADALRISTASGDITGSVSGLTGSPAVETSTASGDVRLEY